MAGSKVKATLNNNAAITGPKNGMYVAAIAAASAAVYAAVAAANIVAIVLYQDCAVRSAVCAVHTAMREVNQAEQKPGQVVGGVPPVADDMAAPERPHAMPAPIATAAPVKTAPKITRAMLPASISASFVRLQEGSRTGVNTIPN
jgi:hypothetical protein